MWSLTEIDSAELAVRVSSASRAEGFAVAGGEVAALDQRLADHPAERETADGGVVGDLEHLDRRSVDAEPLGGRGWAGRVVA